MSNIIRNDPFRDLARFDPFREFEGLWSLPRLRRLFAEMPAEPAIKLDINEDEKAYHVKADLPGVKREDIEVQVEGNRVSLTAEMRKDREEKKDGTLVHSERVYGRQFRSFMLRDEVDEDKVQAKFADGVLELTLPKAAASAMHKVIVQ